MIKIPHITNMNIMRATYDMANNESNIFILEMQISIAVLNSWEYTLQYIKCFF